jgi:hypothetical protein
MHGEAALHRAIADLLCTAGKHDEAKPQLKESARIMREIGDEEGEYQPEIWKLLER